MAALDFEELKGELIRHLRNLVRIDTSNPPGNEIQAVRYIAEVLAAEDIAHEILEPFPGRGSIVARLKGDGTRPPLLLMAHLDVVPVEPEHWEHPPFSAELVDGWIWGRGTLDCKNTVALWLTAMLALKRHDVPLKRDVIFMASADEEAGGKHGLGWIVENRYDLIDAEAALNEGGGLGIELLGKTFYTYQNAEKGNLCLRLTAHGEPGHGSVPRDDNAVLAIMEALRRLMAFKSRPRMIETTRAMVGGLARSQAPPVSWLIHLLKRPAIASRVLPLAIKDEVLGSLVKALLRNTVCPTVLQAGQRVNSIPSQASAEVDIRILPGYAAEVALQDVRECLGPDIQVDVLDSKTASESPVRHALADSIGKAVAGEAPESHVIPILFPAVTDGAYLRPKGMVVYGFSPLRPNEPIEDIHGHNERISLESLDFSLRVGLKTILDFVS